MCFCWWFPAAAPWVGCETATAGHLRLQGCRSLRCWCWADLLFCRQRTPPWQWATNTGPGCLCRRLQPCPLQGSFPAKPHSRLWTLPRSQSQKGKMLALYRTAPASSSISAGGRQLCFIVLTACSRATWWNNHRSRSKLCTSRQSGFVSQPVWNNYGEQSLFKRMHGLNSVIQADFEYNLLYTSLIPVYILTIVRHTKKAPKNDARGFSPFQHSLFPNKESFRKLLTRFDRRHLSELNCRWVLGVVFIQSFGGCSSHRTVQKKSFLHRCSDIIVFRRCVKMCITRYIPKESLLLCLSVLVNWRYFLPLTGVP